MRSRSLALASLHWSKLISKCNGSCGCPWTCGTCFFTQWVKYLNRVNHLEAEVAGMGFHLSLFRRFQ
ncbi:hypothetical protein FKM82_022449 [Ascaphus truei]